ncbi:MAG: hypothetical protein ABJA67_05365 [Chthonomonadales bacterium]
MPQNSLAGKLGLWTDSSEKAQGHLHDIQALGFDYLVVRVTHLSNGHAVPHSPATLKQLIKDAATIDLKIACWAYVFPTNIQDQIDGISAALPPEIDNLILDAEVEWEGIPDASAHTLMHGIAEATGHHAGLHLSSFCNPVDHPIPYKAFLTHSLSFMPQSYLFPPTSPATILHRTMVQSLPLAQFSLCKQLIPTVNAAPMLQAIKNPAFKGASVWLWHDDGTDDKGVQGRESIWQPAIDAWKSP